jgi:uncharacterized protein (DUF2267 family)
VTVTNEQFADMIRDRAVLPDRLPDTQAVLRPAAGVLSTLADQLTEAAAQRLAEDLPEAFRSPLSQGSRAAEGGTMESFYAAVAQRSGVPNEEVPALVTAVLRSMVDVADRDAVRGASEQLTTELKVLLQTDTGEADTSFQAAAGPRDPDARKLAGPEAEI